MRKFTIRRAARALSIAALSLALALGGPGCATISGLATGAFTGAVDLPAEVYRHHETFFYRNPIFHAVNVLVCVPVGLATGPVIGLVKGLAVDVEWLIGLRPYKEVFGSYETPSIWRPFTVRWH